MTCFKAAQQQQSANQQRQQPQANMGLQGMRSAPRYPTPIQRPMAYRGRPGPPQQRSGGKPYFEAQGPFFIRVLCSDNASVAFSPVFMGVSIS